MVYDPRLPKAKQGRVLSEMTLNSDAGSTLIDLAGLPVPEAHTGRSFASLMRGDEASGWRKDFLCDFWLSQDPSPVGKASLASA